MPSIRVTIALALLAVAAYIVYQVATTYRASTGTTWERLLSTAKDSATVLWAKFVTVVAALSGFLGEFADSLGAPGVKESIQNALANPVWVALFVVGVSAISVLARKRTL